MIIVRWWVLALHLECFFIAIFIFYFLPLSNSWWNREAERNVAYPTQWTTRRKLCVVKISYGVFKWGNWVSVYKSKSLWYIPYKDQ